MESDEDLLEGEDDVGNSARSSRRRWAWLLAVGVLIAGSLTASRLGSRLWRGEADLAGRRLYIPTHPTDADALARIDFERVHSELLPQWVVSASRARRGRASAQSEATAFAELRGELAPDRNLVDLAEALRNVVLDGLDEDPERALYLTWAWSRYLESTGEPWLVHGRVQATRHGPLFALAIYAIVDEAVISVGVRDQRVRAVRRVDGINLREAFLGATTRDDPVAIVSIDRLEELVTRELWPLLGPPGSDTTASRSAFTEAVRTEARSALGPTHFRALERTADVRAAILETIDLIHARHQCGSRFRIHAIPAVGFDGKRLERLRRFAETSRGRCPSITRIEVDRLAELSRALDDAASELEPALASLRHWGAEMVSVHEARHLADAQTGADFERGPACPGCPPNLRPDTRNELSGYLAGLAWSGAPATTFYQACRATSLDPFGPHVEAIGLIQAELGVRCNAAPPADLVTRARTLEHTLLGRSDPIAVVHPFSIREPDPAEHDT